MSHRTFAKYNRLFVALLAFVCTTFPVVAMAAGTAGNTSSGSTNYPNGGMRRMDSVTIPTADDNPWSAVIDAEKGVAYYGTGSNPGRVVKINLGEGITAPSYVNYSVMNSNEDDLMCGVIDPENQLAYFGVNTDTPGRVVKVNLSLSYFPRAGGISLSGNLPRSALIDAVNGYLYFGTDTSPGHVLKVDIAPERTFVEVGTPLTCLTGEDKLLCAAIDTSHGYAYFGTYTEPGHVIKVSLGSGASGPTRVGAVTLDAGENNLRSAVIDVEDGYAYFGSDSTDTSPAKIIKVALGDGNTSPSRVSALTLNSGERRLWCATIDTTAHLAWFGMYTNPAQVVKVNLGEGDNPPTHMGTLTLTTNTEKQILSVAGDPALGYAHFGTQQSSGGRPVVRVALSQKSFIKGMRVSLPETSHVNSVSFYSHTASGNVRLALYSTANPPSLLWESEVAANTAEQDWLSMPIAAGSPASLQLTAGAYYLVWQVDTNASVPGYLQGNSGDGFYIPFLWGTFPASLQGDTAPVTTDETWGAYLTYGMTSEGEGEPAAEGETPVEGEGETPTEGEGEIPVEGEGETHVEGEGELPAEGEGETPDEGEIPDEGEGETPVEGEGEISAEGEGETPVEGEGEISAEGEGEPVILFALEYEGPNPVYALSGDRIELTVNPVNNTGTVHYQWYHAAAEKSFHALQDASEATLILVPITETDAGRYFCRATDDISQAQSPEILLHVDMRLSLFPMTVFGLAVLLTVLSVIGATAMRNRGYRAPHGKER